jgi:hypothetical protein
MFKLSVAVAGVLLFTAVHANDQVIDHPLVAQSLEGFHREAAAIRAGMQPGGRYEFLNSGDRSRVDARLNTMEAVLQKHASQNDLSGADKITLINAQEEVNGILKHNDANRLVCESRAPVGSHIPVRTCRTYGEIEQGRRETQKSVSDMSTKFRVPNASGN